MGDAAVVVVAGATVVVGAAVVVGAVVVGAPVVDSLPVVGPVSCPEAEAIADVSIIVSTVSQLDPWHA